MGKQRNTISNGQKPLTHLIIIQTLWKNIVLETNLGFVARSEQRLHMDHFFSTLITLPSPLAQLKYACRNALRIWGPNFMPYSLMHLKV